MRSGRRTKQSTLHGTGSGWYEPRPAPEKPAPKHSQAAKMGHHNAGRGLGDGRFPGHPGRPSKAEKIAARKSYLEKTSPGTTDWFQFMGPTGRVNLDLVGYPGGGDIGLFAQEGVRSDRLEIISRIISRVPEPVQKTTRRLFVYKDFLQEGDLPGMAMGSDTETLGFAKSDTIHIFGAGQDLHDNRAYEAKAEYIIHHELAHGMFERLDRELQEFKREAPRKLKGEERRAFNQRQWEDEEKELMALNEWETDRDLKIDSWESDQKRKVYHRDYKRDSTIERKIMEVEEETRKRKLMLERVYKDKRFKIEMKTWEPLMRSMRRDDLGAFENFNHETQQGKSDASFYVSKHQIFSNESTANNENFAEYMRITNSAHVEPWQFEDLCNRPAWPHFRELMAEHTAGHAIPLDLGPEQEVKT